LGGRGALPGDQPSEQAVLHSGAGHATGEQASDKDSGQIHGKASCRKVNGAEGRSSTELECTELPDMARRSRPV
jgi:hypothetical protein